MVILGYILLNIISADMTRIILVLAWPESERKFEPYQIHLIGQPTLDVVPCG